MTTVHVLHGDNDLQREEALSKIIHAAGLMPDLRDLNTEVLTKSATVAELRRACSTIPFLGDARIVIAREILSQAKGKLRRKSPCICRMFPRLPH